MSTENDEPKLSGKTFDQQIKSLDGDLDGQNLHPNKQLSAEIVFEPVGRDVRVTARDGDHQVLWGFYANQKALEKEHSAVAVYDTLKQHIANIMRGHQPEEKEDPVKAAEEKLDRLTNKVDDLKERLDVNTITEATERDARKIEKTVSDILSQLSLELRSVSQKG